MNKQRNAVQAVSFLMLMQLAISYLAKMSYSMYNNGEVGYVFYILSFLVPILVYVIFFSHKVEAAHKLSLLKLPSARDCLLYFFTALAITLIAARANNMFLVLLKLFGVSIGTAPSVIDGGILNTIISSVALPAMLEELLCRYAVLGLLFPYGKTTAAITSGLLFGMMHINPAQIIYAAATGCVIGAFVSIEKSVALGIFIHAGINLLAVTLAYANNALSPFVFTALNVAVEVTAYIIGTISIIYLIKRYQKRNPKTTMPKIAKLFPLIFSLPILIYLAIAMAVMLKII